MRPPPNTRPRTRSIRRRMAGDFDDDSPRTRVREVPQAAMHLRGRRGRQPLARVAEAAVAGAERADDPGRLAAGLEQRAQDFARAGLAEGTGEADQSERRGRRTVEPRGQIRERAAADGTRMHGTFGGTAPARSTATAEAPWAMAFGM